MEDVYNEINRLRDTEMRRKILKENKHGHIFDPRVQKCQKCGMTESDYRFLEYNIDIKQCIGPFKAKINQQAEIHNEPFKNVLRASYAMQKAMRLSDEDLKAAIKYKVHWDIGESIKIFPRYLYLSDIYYIILITTGLEKIPPQWYTKEAALTNCFPLMITTDQLNIYLEKIKECIQA